MSQILETEEYLEYLENFITPERKQKFLEILKMRTKHFTIAIEDVYQLHNTSAVMRSCEVFGIQELHVIEQKFGKKIDSEIAMGAQKWVDVFRYSDSYRCIHNLKEKGYQIIAATPHYESTFLTDFDITPKSAFFFGTEKEGLSDIILDKADGYLKIPMVGFTESLNISVAAAIVIQFLTQKLRNSSIEWQLSENELFEKKLDWARKSIRNMETIEKRYLDLIK